MCWTRNWTTICSHNDALPMPHESRLLPPRGVRLRCRLGRYTRSFVFCPTLLRHEIGSESAQRVVGVLVHTRPVRKPRSAPFVHPEKLPGWGSWSAAVRHSIQAGQRHSLDSPERRLAQQAVIGPAAYGRSALDGRPRVSMPDTARALRGLATSRV